MSLFPEVKSRMRLLHDGIALGAAIVITIVIAVQESLILGSFLLVWCAASYIYMRGHAKNNE